MSMWLQNLLVILAVAACAAFLARQAWRTLAGKRSKLGSCCSTGCAAHEPKKANSGQRIVFLPADALGRKK
ncbi:MAG: hypothetical protein ABSC42_17745 [Tepidisphaeraceae bacterium]